MIKLSSVGLFILFSLFICFLITFRKEHDEKDYWLTMAAIGALVLIFNLGDLIALVSLL